MQKKSNSRGLSAIVTTLLLILLTLVAVGIVWIVVRNVIQNGAEQVSLGKFTLSLEIVDVMRYADENSMDIKIKRNTGEGDISGLEFIAESEEGSEIIKINNLSFKQLEEKTFSNLNLTSPMNVSTLEKVSVAPIFRLETGKDVVGDIADVYTFSGNIEKSQINCTDTCSSLGYACGVQDICGNIVNCGTCSGGDICNGTICAPCQDAGCISNCGNLSTDGENYILTSDVNSTETCFNILAPNITLDCQNHLINYSLGGTGNTYGIYTNQLNTIIRNCNVVDGNWTSPNTNRYGIYFNANNYSNLYDNFLNTSNSYGIYLRSSNHNILTNNIGTSTSNVGIHLSSSSGNTLMSNTGTSNSKYGILVILSSNNTLISNNGISNTNIGLWLSASSNSNLINNIGKSNANVGLNVDASSNCTFRNNNGTSNSNLGIWLFASSNNTLINNTGTSFGIMPGIRVDLSSNNNTFIKNTAISSSSYALGLSSSSNNTFISQTAIGDSANGIWIFKANNTIFRDCVNISGTTDVFYFNTPGSPNNTFVNCSYDTEDIGGLAGNELIRKWYYQAYVNYTNGSAIFGADVSAFNNLNVQQFTGLTNSSGWIGRQEIIEYVNTGGTKNYYSNYTINATKTGYITGIKKYNITLQQNNLNDYFILN